MFQFMYTRIRLNFYGLKTNDLDSFSDIQHKHDIRIFHSLTDET